MPRTTAPAPFASWTRFRADAPDQAQNYWWIRGRSAFLTGHPIEGTRALVERERYLSDPPRCAPTAGTAHARIRGAAEHGQSLKAPPKTDPIVAGWLDLGPVAVELERNPLHASADWRIGSALSAASGQRQCACLGANADRRGATEFPNQIALLLPLSGRAEAVGVAVRDGFIAAYLEQDAGQPAAPEDLRCRR
jgi:outer membrane PBP1 activator LpoA protein